MEKQKSALLEKIPPQNLEAEESLLGSMLISEDAIPVVTEIIRIDDFYREANRKIFGAIVGLYQKGEPADPITVAEELKTMGALEGVGGKAYLHTLISGVPTAANAKYYAEIVERNAVLRSLIRVATEIAALGYQAPDELDILIDKAESLIFGISQKRISEKFVCVRDLLVESFEQIEKLYEKKTNITGVATGFTDFDEMTSGLHTSDLIVIAARPSMGKTSLALGIASNVALNLKIPVAVFSLEMSRQQLAQRLICSEARVDATALRTGNLKEEDWPKLSNAVGRLSEAPIYIDDTANITIMEVRAKARRLMTKEPLGLIIVDYLQLMQGSGRQENRQQEISDISRALKILGRELNVPVIAISQLSRAVENRQDKRPLLSDLRECVTGETIVVLQDGRRIPIRELVGKEPEVFAVSPEGHIVSAKSDKVWCVGKRPVYKVYLSSGRTIRATAKHRLLGASGWVRVENLIAGDRIALARSIPEPVDNDELRQQASNDLFWDKVVNIVPDGEEEVFDLTVPGPACWLADGIVSHNSGAIEQDADLVVFVYRDEYYRRDSEDKGIAEVIISKHRNGPTGIIRLAFLEHYTKFANLARSV
ncbi:MAG: replicative DNA helicase [Actinobacteria bacterium]|nr:replicative DNA helicase [Actinomycetota bacterium]